MSSARECELLWCYNVITCERVVLQCDKGRPGSEKSLVRKCQWNTYTGGHGDPWAYDRFN